MSNPRALAEKLESFQHLLATIATGGSYESGQYERMRGELLGDPAAAQHLPRFVRTCRSRAQFWEFIKHESPTYAGRRQFIWGTFGPILEAVEARAPHTAAVEKSIASLEPEVLADHWRAALARCAADPAGAVTRARTLLESVCKLILEDGTSGDTSKAGDLPALYQQVATKLNLAAATHVETTIKKILQGCTTVVHGLGELRNVAGDAHGQGRRTYRPEQRHAELSVNLSGSMAAFLAATWMARGRGTATST